MKNRKFERYDEHFACPNCENALPHDEFPQTCLECGFTIEVFLSREDAHVAISRLEEDKESITTETNYVFSLGWVIGYTRMLLA
jgi:hypothetical protein